MVSSELVLSLRPWLSRPNEVQGVGLGFFVELGVERNRSLKIKTWS